MPNEPVFRKLLNREFEKRAARNPTYSLRAFARDLDLSPALLSGVLNGKKGLSEKMGRRIGTSLALTRPDFETFVFSVISCFSRSAQKKQEAAIALEKPRPRGASANLISGEQLKSIGSWIHLALLELCELPDCTYEPRWFAYKLKLNETVVRRSLEALVEAGEMEMVGKLFRATKSESATSSDLPSLAIKKFHAGVLSRAEQALFHNPVEAREFVSMTLAFNDGDLEAAKSMIREFQDEFAKRFYRSSKKKRNSVYQLSTQLFPLTK